jgi:phosphoglycolate phosphatase-like HAD superfamily hydrolase
MANSATPKLTPVRAVFFDIDGTLIDSNYLHIEAWERAFADLDVPVDAWRLHRSIGMDAGKLLEALIPEGQPDEIADKAKELHSKYYEELVPRLRAFEGGRELVKEHLRAVLDLEPVLAEITSGEDVETAKPDPGIVEVALKKAGAEKSNTIMIGDAVWDVESATTAGVSCIGVLTGGISRAELLEAGAIAVYDDVAQILAELEQSPLARLWSE